MFNAYYSLCNRTTLLLGICIASPATTSGPSKPSSRSSSSSGARSSRSPSTRSPAGEKLPSCLVGNWTHVSKLLCQLFQFLVVVIIFEAVILNCTFLSTVEAWKQLAEKADSARVEEISSKLVDMIQSAQETMMSDLEQMHHLGSSKANAHETAQLKQNLVSPSCQPGHIPIRADTLVSRLILWYQCSSHSLCLGSMSCCVWWSHYSTI